MLYRHKWIRPAVIDKPTFDAIRADFRKLVRPMVELGVHLAGPDGRGTPSISSGRLAFNGRERCGCRPEEGGGAVILKTLLLDYLDTDMTIQEAVQATFAQAAIIGEDTLHDLDWHKRRCIGSCAYEGFVFPRVADPNLFWVGEDGRVGDSCQTNRRYYDLAVMAALLVARRHIGPSFEVWTAGRREWWEEARQLTERVLGYGAEIEFHWWEPGRRPRPVASYN